MTRDKPLAAGSGRQSLPAPLEDCHLHHGRLGAQIVDDRREAHDEEDSDEGDERRYQRPEPVQTQGSRLVTSEV